MTALATSASPTTVVTDALGTTTRADSSNARPADVNGRNARPCLNPRPITAPIVAAAATVPTRNPVAIRDALIARKETVTADVLKGNLVVAQVVVKVGAPVAAAVHGGNRCRPLVMRALLARP
jgi:hypothetical protein